MTSATKILLLEESPNFGFQLQSFLWENQYFDTQVVLPDTPLKIIPHLNPALIICTQQTEEQAMSWQLSCPVLVIQLVDNSKPVKGILSFPTEKKAILDQISLHIKKGKPKNEINDLLIRQNQKLHKILVSDILFVESDGNQTILTMQNGEIYTTNNSLTKILDLLPKSAFIRIHKKYIVQFPAIESILPDKRQVCLQNHLLPIGRTFKKDLFGRFEVVG